MKLKLKLMLIILLMVSCKSDLPKNLGEYVCDYKQNLDVKTQTRDCVALTFYGNNNCYNLARKTVCKRNMEYVAVPIFKEN